MTPDTYILKLSGKAESPKPLKISNNIRVALSGAITSETMTDNDDGSTTHIYLFKPVQVELLTELGETLKLKDTRSRSQIFRASLFRIWKENNYEGEFEAFYDGILSNLIRASAEVAEMYKQV